MDDKYLSVTALTRYIKYKLDNDKMNSIGKENYDLSKSWFEKEGNKRSVEQLKKNTINYFTKIVGSSSQDNMWTCFKECIPNLKGKGYTKGWIPLNSRATMNLLIKNL